MLKHLACAVYQFVLSEVVRTKPPVSYFAFNKLFAVVEDIKLAAPNVSRELTEGEYCSHLPILEVINNFFGNANSFHEL